MNQRLICSFAVLLLLTSCNLHGESPIVKVTKSMAHGEAVSEAQFGEAFSNEEMSRLNDDELRQTFSACRKLIDDPRVEVQRHGAICFYVIERSRFDTDPFVEPYLPDFEKLVADRSTLVTPMLINIMNQQRKIPARTSKFFLAHLEHVYSSDKNRTFEEKIEVEGETIATLGGLIGAHSRPITAKVIEYIKASDSRSIQGTIIQALGVNRVSDPEFLDYMMSVLKDPASDLHWNAIQAVARLSPEVKKTFGAEILRLSVEPNTPQDVKEMANDFLKHQAQ